MPTIYVINDTQVPLHISFRHVSPLHFVNGVGPGEKAEFHVGSVFFTVEARIDQGGTNGYTRFESVAAPIAITVTVLSLGAGAIYFAGAASAAGGMSAAVAAISARIGATAATHGPTVRRLYKYAKQGQRIVQIGNVIGIGGGAWLGLKAADQNKEGEGEADGKAVDKKTKKKDKKAASSNNSNWSEHKRVKEAKNALKGLLEGSVVSSPGWYMNKERTLRITGGPRASIVDDLLVIETDTLEPFKVEAVEDDKNGKDGKKVVEEAGEGQGEVVPKRKEGEEKDQPWYDRLSDSSKWLYARIKRSPHEPAPRDDSDAEEDYELPGSTKIEGKSQEKAPRPSSSSLAPPPNDEPGHPPTVDTVLSEMGFNEGQIQEAVKALGLESAEEKNPDLVEKAVFYLVSKDQEQNSSSASTSPPQVPEPKSPPLVVDVLNAGNAKGKGENLPATQEKMQDGQAVTTTPSTEESKRPAGVVGADAVTKPHWTERARKKLEETGAFKALDAGSSHLLTKGEKWLQRDDTSKVTRK